LNLPVDRGTTFAQLDYLVAAGMLSAAKRAGGLIGFFITLATVNDRFCAPTMHRRRMKRVSYCSANSPQTTKRLLRAAYRGQVLRAKVPQLTTDLEKHVTLEKFSFTEISVTGPRQAQ
jgi:hypothetical protein